MSEHIASGDPAFAAHGVTPTPEHAAAPAAFTDADWAGFQADDFAAGRAVVVLMLGIFSTGVLIYSIVAYNVMS